MAKVTGATLQFWFGGIEYPVESAAFDGAWEELETTDSATLTPATDFIVNRAKRTTKVDAMLNAAQGGNVATGNLIANTKYRVRLGNITEGVLVHPVGKLFTSDGTGAATASNQVAILGAKLPGKNMVCSINNANAAVISMKFNEAYGEFDATDSASTGDSTEWVTGRVKRTTSIEMIMIDTTADMIEASPTSLPVVLTFGSGLTLTGNAIFTKKSITSIAKGDMVKVSYDMTWVGPVTSTLAETLAMGSSNTCRITWKGYGTTDKAVSGNAIVMSKAIEADVHGVGKVSYGLAWVGAVTENEYT